MALSSTFAKQADWNAYALAILNYEHDFGNDRGNSFEASLSTYYARQFEISRVNLGAAELQAGPRLAVFPDQITGLSAKIYGIVNGYTLGDDPYVRTFGAGVALRHKVNPILVVEHAFEYRDRRYYNSGNYPTAAEQTGDLFTYALGGYGRLSDTIRWVARIGVDRSQADFSFWSYSRLYLDVGMPITVTVPWFNGATAWVISPYVGGSLVNFDTPDPLYDPTQARKDNELHVGATAPA